MARSKTRPQSVNLQTRGGNDHGAGRRVDHQAKHSSEEATSEGESERSECDECGGDLITYTGEVRCGDCGLVHEEARIDHQAEWRGCIARSEGETGQNLVRCNGGSRNPTHHDHGLGSHIGYTNSDARQLSRMRTHQHRSKFENKAERNLSFAFGEVKRITSALDLGRQVEERACSILRNAQEEGAFEGDTIEELVGGGVYAACRELSLARLPAEIADVLRYTEDDVTGDFGVAKAIQNAYGKLCRTLGLGIAPLKPADHIPRAADQLDLDDKTRAYAITVARHLEEEGGFVGTGRAPSGMAAGCIYYASQEVGSFLTQAEVSETLNVAAKTSRDTYQDLVELDTLPAAPRVDEDLSVSEPDSMESPSTATTVEAEPAQPEGETVEVESADFAMAGADASGHQDDGVETTTATSDARREGDEPVVSTAESTATPSETTNVGSTVVQEQLPGTEGNPSVEADPPLDQGHSSESPADEGGSSRSGTTEQTYLWEFDTRQSVSAASESGPEVEVAGADS